MKKKYIIAVEEIIRTTVMVEAESPAGAKRIVQEKYENGVINPDPYEDIADAFVEYVREASERDEKLYPVVSEDDD